MSRAKFEEWYELTHAVPNVDGWTMHKRLDYGVWMAAWLAGRESMRDEASRRLENSVDGFTPNTEWAIGYLQATKDVLDGLKEIEP